MFYECYTSRAHTSKKMKNLRQWSMLPPIHAPCPFCGVGCGQPELLDAHCRNRHATAYEKLLQTRREQPDEVMS